MSNTLFAVFFGIMAGFIFTVWCYGHSNPRMVYTEYKETIAQCEAELPRNKTCTVKVIAEVAE